MTQHHPQHHPSIREEEFAASSLPAAEHSASGYDISGIEILIQLAHRKWLIVKATSLSMLAGVTLALLSPVLYTGVTKIMPPQPAPSSTSMLMSQLAGAGGNPLAAITAAGLGLKNPNDTYIGLLNSRPVADAVIEKFGLVKVYRAADMTAARKRLAANTEVTSEKDGFISVSVTDSDKNRVAAMANAYIEELRKLTKGLAVTEASQRRLFYEEQLNQARTLLVGAEASFLEVQQTKGLVQLDAQARTMIQGAANLRAQVVSQRVRLQALRSSSTENNPDVALAEQELSSLQAEAARLEQKGHYSGIANLGLGDVPGAGLEYVRAEHELKYRQAMFDLLMKQYEGARLDEAKDAAIIQVVEPAIEPDHKTSPKRTLIVLLFTLTGFFAGGVWAVLSWLKDRAQSDPYVAAQYRQLLRALVERKSATAGSSV
ncbi:MAG: GNVR domain-containing protein [Terriglobales bacterium]